MQHNHQRHAFFYRVKQPRPLSQQHVHLSLQKYAVKDHNVARVGKHAYTNNAKCWRNDYLKHQWPVTDLNRCGNDGVICGLQPVSHEDGLVEPLHQKEEERTTSLLSRGVSSSACLVPSSDARVEWPTASQLKFPRTHRHSVVDGAVTRLARHNEASCNSMPQHHLCWLRCCPTKLAGATKVPPSRDRWAKHSVPASSRKKRQPCTSRPSSLRGGGGQRAHVAKLPGLPRGWEAIRAEQAGEQAWGKVRRRLKQ